MVKKCEFVAISLRGVFVPFFNEKIESKFKKERRWKKNLNMRGMIRRKTKKNVFYLWQ